MNPTLATFLKEKVVIDKDDHTHNSQATFQKFFINNEELSQFFQVYMNELHMNLQQKSSNKFSEKVESIIHNKQLTYKQYDTELKTLYSRFNFKASLSEKPHTVMPLLGDIDFRIVIGNHKPGFHLSTFPRCNLYTEAHIKKVVSIYHQVLKSLTFQDEAFQIENLDCFVLTKNKPTIDTKTGDAKNGFHLHFPYFYMTEPHQDQYVYKRVLELAKKERLFIDDPLQYEGETIQFEEDDLEKIIDKRVATKHWLLYGSMKDFNNALNEPYLLKYIFRLEMTERGQEELVNISLAECIRDHGNVIWNADKQPIECAEFTDEQYQYYLPLILSTRCFDPHRHTMIVQGQPEIIISKPITIQDLSRSSIDTGMIEKNIETAREIINNIINKQQRAENYTSWIEMGWCLFNISHGILPGLDLYKEFSSIAPNYDPASCVQVWENSARRNENNSKSNEKNINMTRLKQWAEEDNPDIYAEWKEKFKYKLMQRSKYSSQLDLAKLVRERFKDTFVCTDVKTNDWFKFDGNRWIYCKQGVEFQNIIPDYLIGELNKHLESLKQIPETAENGSLITESTKNIRELMYKKLGTNSYLNDIFSQCKKLFFDAQFKNKLDTNPYILGFNNCVLDLNTIEKNGKKTIVGFRQGITTDYVSMSCGYDYHDLNGDEPVIKELKDFFVKLFTKKTVRDFMFKSIALLLRGGNNEKTFLVASGVGDNGKSMLVDLLENTLGQYMAKLPTTFLTQKSAGSSSASPETARLNGVRLVVLQEPSEHERMNEGTLKEYTGNDSTYERSLFGEGREVKHLMKMWLICNKLPNITASDQAVWNRIRRVVFESKFPKDPSLVPTDIAEQYRKRIYPRDDFLSEKLVKWKQAMMFYMVLEYRKSLIEKIKDPEEVTNATMQYLENNDPYFQFKRSQLVKDDTNKIDANDMFEAYKTWHQDFFNNNRFPTKSQFIADSQRCLGTVKRNTFSGLRMRNDTDPKYEEEDVNTVLDITEIGQDVLDEELNGGTDIDTDNDQGSELDIADEE